MHYLLPNSLCYCTLLYTQVYHGKRDIFMGRLWWSLGAPSLLVRQNAVIGTGLPLAVASDKTLPEDGTLARLCVFLPRSNTYANMQTNVCVNGCVSSNMKVKTRWGLASGLSGPSLPTPCGGNQACVQLARQRNRCSNLAAHGK